MSKDNHFFEIGVIAVAFFLFWIYFVQPVLYEAQAELYNAIPMLFFTFTIILCLGIIIAIIIRKIIRKKAKEESYKSEIDNISNKHFTDLASIEIGQKKLDNLKSDSKLALKYSDLIKEADSNIAVSRDNINESEKKAIRDKNSWLEEAKRRKREEELTIEKQSKEKAKLLTYFRRNKSINTLPRWSEHLDRESINNVQKTYLYEVRHKLDLEKYKKEAEEFVLKYNALPKDFHKMSDYERKAYITALDLKKQGKLKKNISKQVSAKRKPVYSISELSDDDIDYLIKQHNYKKINFRHRDGSSGNILLIKNETKESDEHLCMKYVFAGLDKDKSEVDYQIDDNSVDLAFIYNKGKIAVEIESGIDNIGNKQNWLNKNFNYWIIVCRKEYLSNYKKYVDNKKSFCLRTKQADETLRQLTDSLR